MLVSLMTACGGDPGATPPDRPASNATEAPLLPVTTSALPDIDAAGFSTLLGQLEGTPVVVNIWGSWCGPCRREAAHLAAAANEYGADVQFLGLDILDTKEAGRRFIDEFAWNYPSVFDPSPGADIRNQLGFIGQPVTIFYDAQGQQVDAWEGAITPDELDKRIQALLPAPVTPPTESPAAETPPPSPSDVPRATP